MPTRQKSLFLGVLLMLIHSASAAMKVACIGDSITYGARVENRERLCYPMQLGAMLGDKYEVRNFGVNGRTLLHKGDLPYWKTGQYKQALSWKPDVVVIKLGTNDTKMVNWQHKDEMAKDLSELADSFLQVSPKAIVYLSYPVPAFLDGKQIDRKRVKEGVIPIIKEVARAKKLPVINFYKRMEDKEDMMPDKAHPNARGAFELAAEVFLNLTGKSYNGKFADLKEKLMKGLPPASGEWHGFKIHKFSVKRASCQVVAPKKVAPGKPWIWRARFFGHEPQTDIALLKKGFHVAYCDVANLFGSAKAISRWNDFYNYATTELGFSKKVALEGMSRGGLIIFNWARQNPKKVSCIYGDAPVCDFKSWPGGKGKGKGDGRSWMQCQKAYDFKTEADALAWKENPIDNAAAIAKAKIPVMIVYGKADVVVPDFENCLIFEKNFKAAGGDIVMIGKENCGHHPHSLKDPKQIVDFVLKNTNSKKIKKKVDNSSAIEIRRGLKKSFMTFFKGKEARVAFLGGSITEMPGWRNHVADSLRKRFPNTEFDFVFGGIGSTDSTMGAFRIEKDIFKNGKVDLLFIESAVNELHNGRKEEEILRAVEGIIRHALLHNPDIDIIAQYFSDRSHLKKIRNGSMPWQIKTLDSISEYYGLPSINQVILLNEALMANKITEKEFALDGCHPAPKGHLLYAKNIDQLFDSAFKRGSSNRKSLPEPMVAENFEKGKYLDIKKAVLGQGWKYIENWKPALGGTRKQFVNLPVLEATTPNAELTLEFSGIAIGITLPAGPDVGIIEYKVDNGNYKKLDLFTRWSRGLNIPWIYMLETSLKKGKHTLTLRTSTEKNKGSKGTACRICYFAVDQ